MLTENLENMTPMMKQYKELKNTIPPDALLLFRLGDFYEMFFEDAVRGSSILDITLTKRHDSPMCGIPFHALDNYLPKLIESGLKIAIADQIGDPKSSKGIVKREISRIITPGTIIESSVLSSESNNYLSALSLLDSKYGVACLDISTGEFKITELSSFVEVENELQRLSCKEIILSEELYKEIKEIDSVLLRNSSLFFSVIDESYFDYDSSYRYLLQHFSVGSLDGFGCRDYKSAVCAAGAALQYASENLKNSSSHINSLKTYNTKGFMVLDSVTRRNLELIESKFTTKNSTLFSVIDKTKTSMGGRLLKEWILQPLFDKDAIIDRLDAVSDFKYDAILLAEIQEYLGGVRDLERIISRLNIGSSNARDLLALASSLNALPQLKDILSNFKSELVHKLHSQIELFPDLVELLFNTIVDEPPLTISDGGMIKSGCDKLLDELRSASTEGKNWIAALQAKEQERTGVKSLKIRYNKVFGYYIEITNTNLAMVPQDYIRKQTMSNCERFITPELKVMENKILGSEEKSKSIEVEIFHRLRENCVEFTSRIKNVASAVANIDVLSSLADAAISYNYVRPKITDGDLVSIKGGRHPVIEYSMTEERFVPNDLFIDNESNNVIIITGPNMAGKSTYIRQNAILVLMAQIGSFIPCDEAEIGIVDRIFTRVGASDDLSRGQSTFMVEMVETANILNHATQKSLIVLDEIGRGTSTFDGVSIAWSVAEYIHNNPKVKAKTLFATHYHELTELSMTCKGVKNYTVSVKEYGENIVFLRQIVAGTADKSYGIHVAKLAGLPSKVINRAKEVLDNLENSAIRNGKPVLAKQKNTVKKKVISETEQLELNLF